MTDERDELDAEPREITADTDDEDAQPAGQDATPDVREDSVADFEPNDGDGEAPAGVQP